MRPVWVGALAHHPSCPTLKAASLHRHGPRVHVGQSVVTVLPKTATDVLQLMALHDPEFTVTDVAWNEWFNSIPLNQLTHDQINVMGEWKKFLLTWNSFKTDPALGGVISSDDQYNLVADYVKNLQDWRDELVKLGGGSHIQGPPIRVPARVESPSLPNVTAPITGLAIGVGVAAVALLALTLKK
jgi:hypothetical protein